MRNKSFLSLPAYGALIACVSFVLAQQDAGSACFYSAILIADASVARYSKRSTGKCLQ
jgi:hypothetical protein